MSSFAEVFKSLRIQSGLTQDEMANILKISRSSVGMYEHAEREPSFELLESIADYFNVDIDYLVGRKETTERIPIIEKAPAHSARAMEFISLFENLPEDKKDALLSYASFLSEQAPKDS